MLNALYNQLVDTSCQSLADTLKVGGVIEEFDILNLEERIEGTDRVDILRVYGSLLRGSENHLRAFVSTHERQTGGTYVLENLSQDRFDETMSGSQWRGNGDGGRKVTWAPRSTSMGGDLCGG